MRDSGGNRDAPEEAHLVAVMMMEADHHGNAEEVLEHSDRRGDTMDDCCCFPDMAVDSSWRTMEVALLPDIDADGVVAVYACWHRGVVDRIPQSRRDHCFGCCCCPDRIVHLRSR